MKIPNITDGMILSKIKFKELEASISEYLGLTKRIKLYKQVNGSKMLFTTHTIRENTGIFKNILKSCTINSFGAVEIINGMVWGTVNISYQHKDGGSNGMKICSFEYNTFSKTWEINF